MVTLDSRRKRWTDAASVSINGQGPFKVPSELRLPKPGHYTFLWTNGADEFECVQHVKYTTASVTGNPKRSDCSSIYR